MPRSSGNYLHLFKKDLSLLTTSSSSVSCSWKSKMKLLGFLIPLSYTMASVVAQNITFPVPVPWLVSGLSINNIRHGSGGFWSFDIVDTPTLTPQGFNTTCSYQSRTAAIFAIDDPPYHAPCTNPNVTFGLFPSGGQFVFNVTHKYYGECKTHKGECVDHGNWTFSNDDVRGQEDDVQNNFGQAGFFTHAPFNMYPKRAISSSKCEFCWWESDREIPCREMRPNGMQNNSVS